GLERELALGPLIDVNAGDLRSLGREQSRAFGADAAGRTGDHTDLAFEPSGHTWSSLLGRVEDVLQLRVVLERVGAELAPHARLLEPAKRCRHAHGAV